VPLGPLPQVKEDLEVVLFEPKLQDRPVVQRSLGPHLVGAWMPHPDPSDQPSMVAGVKKRFASAPPPHSRKLRRKFRRFVQRWIKKNLTPLAVDSDVSIETWLAQTNYPAWRKKQLLQKYRAIVDQFDERYFNVKSFQKDEVYPEYKYPRAINSRVDEFKCLTGPVFKLIEKALFKLDWFIKKVPVKDRPRVIFERIGHGYQFIATDHTAYEAHFTREMMEDCEFQLYSYMTQNLPCHEQFMWYMHHVIAGVSKCFFRDFMVKVNATRMSGEMNTSLGNGFSNLMFMLFMCKEKGCKDVSGFVEGDDGIFTMIGEPPTIEDFAELGLTLKCEISSELNTASFCGLVFDVQDQLNVTNVLEELATFGLTTARYARASKRRLMELLKCKAISLAYQYPRCPILFALAKYGLRVTKDYKAKAGYMNEYERALFLEAKLHSQQQLSPPPIRTRMLVEQLYGVSIENQLKVEAYLDSLEEVQPLRIPILGHLFPDSWSDYYYRYAFQVPINEKRPGAKFVAQPYCLAQAVT
jgi:hypothetical protein